MTGDPHSPGALVKDGIKEILERKALQVAWVLNTEQAFGRVPDFRTSTRERSAALKTYCCPVCWLRYERRETLELWELSYTKDGMMRCKTCGDLTTIPSHVLEDVQK